MPGIVNAKVMDKGGGRGDCKSLICSGLHTRPSDRIAYRTGIVYPDTQRRHSL